MGRKRVDLRSLVRNIPSSVTLMEDPEKDVQVQEAQDVTSSAYVKQDRLNPDFDDVASAFSGSSVQSNRDLNETVGNMNVPPLAANKVENYQPRTWIETLTGAGAAAVGPLGARIRDRRHHPVPGRARCATRDGDFIGEIRVGQEVGAFDVAQAALQRFNRAQRAKVAQHKTWHRQGRGLAAGNRQSHVFSSLSALISAATGGKKQDLTFQKAGVAANAAGNCVDLWAQGSRPAAGAAGGAAPTGSTNTSATTGALPFANPGNANTLHFVTGYVTANVAANTLLLYDRLFAVAKTMNSTATEAVSGTFTRYQNAVATAADYVGGNFVFPSSPTAVLPATAHNWTVCQYTNQSGVVGQSIPLIAGVSACVAGGVDLLAGRWFMPLSAGDVGVKALTQMQCSALVASGTIDFVVGHPIAFFPCPVANMVCIVDGINTAFNLTTVFDNACLAFLEMPKPATTAASYSGIISAVAE